MQKKETNSTDVVMTSYVQFILMSKVIFRNFTNTKLVKRKQS